MSNGTSAGWSPRERVLLVLCLLAMGIALSAHINAAGSADAARGKITSGEIANGTITSADLAKGAVKSVDVKNGALQAADIDMYTVEGDITQAGPSQATTKLASCANAGDQVIGGGGIIVAAGQADLALFGSQPGFTPSGNDAWSATFSNFTAGGVPVQPWAICMD